MKVDIYRPDYYVIGDVPQELIKLVERHRVLTNREFADPQHRYHKTEDSKDGIGMSKEEWKEYQQIEETIKRDWIPKLEGVIPEVVYKDLVFFESTYFMYHDDKRLLICPACTCCGALPIPEDATSEQLPWKKKE